MYYFFAFHIWTKFCHIVSKDCDPYTSIPAGFLSQLSVQAMKPPGCQPPWVQCGHEELSLFLGCRFGCGNYDATPRPDAAIKYCRVLVGTRPLSPSIARTLPPHHHLCVLTIKVRPHRAGSPTPSRSNQGTGVLVTHSQVGRTNKGKEARCSGRDLCQNGYVEEP